MTNHGMENAQHNQAWKWLIVALAATVAVIFFVAHFGYTAWDFRNNLWGPARLLLEGESPYDTQTLEGLAARWGIPFYRSLWFPTIVGLGLPLGAISLDQAANIWLLLSLASILASLGLLHHVSGSGCPPRALLPLGAMVVLFAPLYVHLGQGQASLIVLASVIAGWVLIGRDLPVWAGLLLSIGWVKPQLLLLAWPALAWRMVERGVFPRAFAAWLAGSLAQTIPLWLLDPTWLSGYLGALRDNPSWIQPNLQSLVALWFGSKGLGWLVALLALAAVTIWLIRLWRADSRLLAFAWALALTPILSPYTWSYDQVFLLPLLILALPRIGPGPRRAVFWIAVLACQVAFLALRILAVSDAWYAWYPPVVMLLVAGLLPRD